MSGRLSTVAVTSRSAYSLRSAGAISGVWPMRPRPHVAQHAGGTRPATGAPGSPGIDSSLSSVPPVWPRPRPGDHRHVDAAGGGQRGQDEARLVAHAARRVLVDLGARAGRRGRAPRPCASWRRTARPISAGVMPGRRPPWPARPPGSRARRRARSPSMKKRISSRRELRAVALALDDVDGAQASLLLEPLDLGPQVALLAHRASRVAEGEWAAADMDGEHLVHEALVVDVLLRLALGAGPGPAGSRACCGTCGRSPSPPRRPLRLATSWFSNRRHRGQ